MSGETINNPEALIGQIRIADFDYPLPDERIASHPCEPRDACKLLVRDAAGAISHKLFTDVPDLLDADTLLVWNNTRVINARLKFRKATGAVIEIFCLEPDAPRDYVQMFQSRSRCRWSCLVGNLKRWKEGSLSMEVAMPDGAICTLTATLAGEGEANTRIVEFEWRSTGDNPDFGALIEAAGRIPIPPYLNRMSEESDSRDYQTVYSRIEGSVAAPTAGLHFTPAVMSRLQERGIECAEVTLHVGAGTFRPVKSDTIGEHAMHREVFSVSRRLVATLIDALRSGRHIAAVGTTTVRTLESLPWLGVAAAGTSGLMPLHLDQWSAYQSTSLSAAGMLQLLADYMDRYKLDTLTASTSIMIAPGFQWRVVDTIITNFHQPQSTLLLLVSSFISRSGKGGWREMYDNALARDYRFLSYGDSSLLKSK